MAKNDKELSALLESVAGALEDTFRKAEGRLAKADEGSPEGTPAQEETPGEATAGAGGPPPGADAGGPPPGADAGGPPPDDAGGPPPGPDAGGEGGEGGPADWGSIFAQMPLPQLEEAYMALKQAMAEKIGAGGPPGADAGGPPPGPAVGGPPGADAGGPPPEALKSQRYVADLRKSHEELVAQNERLVAGLQKFLEAATKPQRKAVTGVAYLGKNDDARPLAKSVKTMSRAEVLDQMKALATRSDLSKSERDLITAYAVGSVGLTADVEALLNKK